MKHDYKKATRTELLRMYQDLFDERECNDNFRSQHVIDAILEELSTRGSGFVVTVDAEDGRHYLGEYDTKDQAFEKVEKWLGMPIDRDRKIWYSNYGSVISIASL